MAASQTASESLLHADLPPPHGHALSLSSPQPSASIGTHTAFHRKCQSSGFWAGRPPAFDIYSTVYLRICLSVWVCMSHTMHVTARGGVSTFLPRRVWRETQAIGFGSKWPYSLSPLTSPEVPRFYFLIWHTSFDRDRPSFILQGRTVLHSVCTLPFLHLLTFWLS